MPVNLGPVVVVSPVFEYYASWQASFWRVMFDPDSVAVWQQVARRSSARLMFGIPICDSDNEIISS